MSELRPIGAPRTAQPPGPQPAEPARPAPTCAPDPGPQHIVDAALSSANYAMEWSIAGRLASAQFWGTTRNLVAASLNHDGRSFETVQRSDGVVARDMRGTTLRMHGGPHDVEIGVSYAACGRTQPIDVPDRRLTWKPDASRHVGNNEAANGSVWESIRAGGAWRSNGVYLPDLVTVGDSLPILTPLPQATHEP